MSLMRELLAHKYQGQSVSYFLDFNVPSTRVIHRVRYFHMMLTTMIMMIIIIKLYLELICVMSFFSSIHEL